MSRRAPMHPVPQFSHLAPYGLNKKRSEFDPCTATWHKVQDWYFCAWLWNEGAAGAAESTVNVWHSRQSKFTWLLNNNRGFDDPCGVWQDMQPSVFTGPCSNAKGPALSVWQLKQTTS